MTSNVYDLNYRVSPRLYTPRNVLEVSNLMHPTTAHVISTTSVWNFL